MKTLGDCATEQGNTAGRDEDAKKKNPESKGISLYSKAYREIKAGDVEIKLQC